MFVENGQKYYDLYDSLDICELGHRKDHIYWGSEKSSVFTIFMTYENQASVIYVL